MLLLLLCLPESFLTSRLVFKRVQRGSALCKSPFFLGRTEPTAGGGQGGVAPLTGNFNGTGAATLQLSMSSLLKVSFSKPRAGWVLRDKENKEKAQKPSLRGPEQHQTQEFAQRRCLRRSIEPAQLRQSRVRKAG